MTARQEQDREDLLRGATAMVERAELQLGFWPEPVFVGFRRDGSLSVYFGGDPVYQFNAGGELRRAFIDGLLYKADRGRIAELRRERSQHETSLIRRDLGEEAAGFLKRMNELLAQLLSAMEQDPGGQAASGTLHFAVLAEVPAGCGVVSRVHSWLKQHVGRIQIARAPNANRPAGQ
jgi:hypothetical protein